MKNMRRKRKFGGRKEREQELDWCLLAEVEGDRGREIEEKM